MAQEHGLPAYLTAKAVAMEDALRRKPSPHQWLDHLEVTTRTDDASGVRKIDIREWRLLSTGGGAPMGLVKVVRSVSGVSPPGTLAVMSDGA
ncbi:hypothetical protein, partial [Streptomyces sp. NPDC014685]|uniref:hypothetical protein n=1 Tax=Streptomyces sp. NPDC014685 TaxID=3364881 RepID=UPI0036F61B14